MNNTKTRCKHVIKHNIALSLSLYFAPCNDNISRLCSISRCSTFPFLADMHIKITCLSCNFMNSKMPLIECHDRRATHADYDLYVHVLKVWHRLLRINQSNVELTCRWIDDKSIWQWFWCAFKSADVFHEIYIEWNWEQWQPRDQDKRGKKHGSNKNDLRCDFVTIVEKITNKKEMPKKNVHTSAKPVKMWCGCRYVMSLTKWICVGIAWFKNRYSGLNDFRFDSFPPKRTTLN